MKIDALPNVLASRLPLAFIDMTDWDNIPVPERQWCVHGRIPARQVTLFSGEGAAGKSIVALQLAAAHVLGQNWLGSMPVPGPAIYVGCEDEKDELHRRLADICKSYGLKFADLVRGGLHLHSRVEGDALLGVPDRNGKIVPTPFYDRLLDAAADIKPKHIGIDTLADVFGGDEIDRGQVRQFVAMLRRLAITANGSVVLLSHPSQSGISSGSGISGSTAWHNSVRGRIYMRLKDEKVENGRRVIEFKKNQYGRLDDSMTVHYANGVYVPDRGTSEFDSAAEDLKVDKLFLELLTIATGQHRYFGSKPGTNFAPARLAEMPQANDTPKKVLATAMERLFAANKIKMMKDPTRKESKASMVVVAA
jgi:RecA-family ATPase